MGIVCRVNGLQSETLDSETLDEGQVCNNKTIVD